MLPERFEDILSEKVKLEEFLQKLTIHLENILENFETLNTDILSRIEDDISEQEVNAKKINLDFFDKFIKIKNSFKNYLLSFDDSTRFKNEIFLEDFIDEVYTLKEALLKLK